MILKAIVNIQTRIIQFSVSIANRLKKITEMFHIIATYSTLGLSNIEGIDVIHSRFQLSVSGMKKKGYDILDQRKSDFDADFEEFKRQVEDIKVSFLKQ